MAKALGGATALHGTTTLVPSLSSVLTLRLAASLLLVLGSVISTVGIAWDIQWHSFIGRDRTLIPPHIMMLSGIALAGIVALALVAVESVRARRNPQVARYSTDFADLFHAPVGAYIAGFGALNAAIAFPLDSYWHSIYGIDVSIWAPFHVMIIGAGGLIPLGAAFILVSSAHNAARAGYKALARSGYIAAIVAFAAVLSIFTILMANASGDDGLVMLGGPVNIDLFPVLSGLLVAWVLAGVVYAIPWRMVATYVALAYLGFGVVFQLFVPPATSALVTSEQLQYRKSLGQFAALSVVAAEFWFLLPLISALLIDLIIILARRNNWSRTRVLVLTIVAACVSCFPIAPLIPDRALVIIEFFGIWFVLSFVLGVGGAALGILLGRKMGESMQLAEGAR